MSKSEFGVIGLGVMGESLSLNIAEKGFMLSVYNRMDENEAGVVDQFLERNKSFRNILGFTDLNEFVNSLEKPRKILMMVKAGKIVDHVIEELIRFLSPDDILIDGGNSHFLDTRRRYFELTKKSIEFVGCGISGGEEGARRGPSMMPGGSKNAFESVAPILEAIAAKDVNNKPCCSYIASDGAGHFVKMIHNGIEYAEMQLIAELYDLMSLQMSNAEIAQVFSKWCETDNLSYLLEITSKILIKKENDEYIVDNILDKAGNKGTGSWSAKTTLELGVPGSMLTSAVLFRYLSSFKEKRVRLSKLISAKKEFDKLPELPDLEKAYRFARIINHHQGFEIIEEASKRHNWEIDCSELARVWTNGCIIRSKLMHQLSETLKETSNILESDSEFSLLADSELQVADLIKVAVSNRIPFDTFWSAYNYWIAITTNNLPANLIQAQRDYFGAHTYQRVDAAESEFFHTNWNDL